jgi:hypothetical protein
MRNRDTGVLALGRFLAVERYCQATQPSTYPPLRSSRPDRVTGRAAAPVPASGSRAPAQSEHG